MPTREPSETRRRVSALAGGQGLVIAEYGDPAATNVVWAVPGWKGTDLGLKPVLVSLADHGFRVRAVNLPGSGIASSAARELVTLDSLASLIEDAMETDRGFHHRVLLGHSFGATVASKVASRGRVALSALVLASPPVNGTVTWQGRLTRSIAFALARMLQGLPEGVTRAVLNSALITELPNMLQAVDGLRGYRAIRAWSVAERGLVPNPVAIGAHLRLATEHTCLEFAESIQLTTHVVAGTRDSLARTDQLNELCRLLPRGRLSLLEGAGHLAHQERSADFASLIATAAITSVQGSHLT